MRKEATQKHLKNILKYDLDTGVFTWRKGFQRVKAGDVAGSVNDRGYRYISRHPAHRLAWIYVTGSEPKMFIDHINGIKDDNRFINLREASSFEVNQNATISTNNRSGVKGVSWNKKKKHWRANVMAFGKNYFLGCFEYIEDAELAVISKRVDLHGEFANNGE